MANGWTISTEVTLTAQGSGSSGGADPSTSFSFPVERPTERHSIPISKHGTPRRLRTGMFKTSQRPRESSIGLHSQNLAGFPKHPERCAEWFGHFKQRESQGSIDLVRLQEARFSVGEAAGLNKLYKTTWGFMDKLGRTRWTEYDARVEGLRFH